jgi:glutamate synthase (NADPH/NADH) small chain
LQGAIDEGIEIVYNTQPVEVVDGKALRCVRTELGEPDEDGRRRPINIEGLPRLGRKPNVMNSKPRE